MAARLLQTHDVSDLCIGKPALRWLPPSSTVSDAIAELQGGGGGGGRGQDAAVAVWDGKGAVSGRVCMADALLFLCAEGNLASPAAALQATLSDLLAAGGGAPPVRRVEPDASVLEAMDAFLDGAHTLVVPIRERWLAAVGELCWLTVEDLVRFLLSSIALFSPTAFLSVSDLGVVHPATLAVAVGDSALSAVPFLRTALGFHTSVAIVSAAGFPRRLAGELSPSTLCSCDVSVAAAVAALSAGDLMAFVDWGGAPPDATLHAVRSQLRRRNLVGMLDFLDGGDPSSPTSSSSSSSLSSSDDDEDDFKKYMAASCTRQRKHGLIMRRRPAEEVIACHRDSSLVAVMVQAIAHRVTQVWVVDEEEEESELVGIVGFLDVLRVLRRAPASNPPNT